MALYIKSWSLADWEELVKWAKVGANNAMIGEFTEVEEIPPHGDLIERKAAYDSLLNGMVMTEYQSRALDCISGFYVPTIIPAEEGE